MTGNGPSPEVNLDVVQQAVQQYFEKVVDQQPGEVGTCKKMVRLDCLNPQWGHLAVVYAKEPSEISTTMILKEHQLLTHLGQHSYPVVEPFCLPFIVQNKTQRFGMLMPYIPGVFIEAKTPNPLKLLITAALLGLEARAQEGWLVFQRQNLLNDIKINLNSTNTLAILQARALRLAGEFEKLIEQLGNHRQRIHDLQMLISQEGALTIIDPLEVVNISTQDSWTSLLENQTLNNKPDFIRFILATQSWLLRAQQFCLSMSQCPNALWVIEQCSQVGHGPLVFSSIADKQGKSRLHTLKNSVTCNGTSEAEPQVQKIPL